MSDLCTWRDWLDSDDDFPTGSRCGNKATRLNCRLGQMACELHGCRCPALSHSQGYDRLAALEAVADAAREVVEGEPHGMSILEATLAKLDALKEGG